MTLPNLDTIDTVDLDGIKLLLDDAEIAARQIGHPAQMNSVSIARRQLDELREMVS